LLENLTEIIYSYKNSSYYSKINNKPDHFEHTFLLIEIVPISTAINDIINTVGSRDEGVGLLNSSTTNTKTNIPIINRHESNPIAVATKSLILELLVNINYNKKR
jgi:hypothetical protein